MAAFQGVKVFAVGFDEQVHSERADAVLALREIGGRPQVLDELGRNGLRHFAGGLDGSLTLSGFAGQFGAGVFKETFTRLRQGRTRRGTRTGDSHQGIARPQPITRKPPADCEGFDFAGGVEADQTAGDLSFANFQQQRIRGLLGLGLLRKREVARHAQFGVRLASEQSIEFGAKEICAHAEPRPLA